MSKADKLIEKLKQGTISAKELRTLMKKLGWLLDRQVGSHEQWMNTAQPYPHNRLTIATHKKELKPYQINDAKEKVLYGR